MNVEEEVERLKQEIKRLGKAQPMAHTSDAEIPGTPSTLATTFLAFVLNLAFALSVFGFLVMHISLVAANTTTIEAYEKKTTPKWRYDLGRRKNFEQRLQLEALNWSIYLDKI
ncbi:hypothetical protein K1719_012033 [Acacia pycnantha]|nr:hypothetical protein K1719_012033 [Acacia pycnantha]